MKFRPGHTFCGCLSLLMGVEAICLVTILNCICVLAACSSTEPVRLFGATIPPTVQVLSAAWAFIGIPLAINCGVGAVHRVQSSMKMFFWYLIASFFLGLAFPIYTLFTGSFCKTLGDSQEQHFASSFACGMTATLFSAWSLIVSMVQCYFVFTLWSASEELLSTDYPELVRYSDALKQAGVPGASMGPYTGRPSLATSAAMVGASPLSMGQFSPLDGTGRLPMAKPAEPAEGPRSAKVLPPTALNAGNPFATDPFAANSIINPAKFSGKAQSFVPTPSQSF